MCVVGSEPGKLLEKSVRCVAVPGMVIETAQEVVSHNNGGKEYTKKMDMLKYGFQR